MLFFASLCNIVVDALLQGDVLDDDNESKFKDNILRVIHRILDSKQPNRKYFFHKKKQHFLHFYLSCFYVEIEKRYFQTTVDLQNKRIKTRTQGSWKIFPGAGMEIAFK